MQKIKILRGVCLTPKEVQSLTRILTRLGNDCFGKHPDAAKALRYADKLLHTYQD